MRMPQMAGAGQPAPESAPIIADPADADPAEADAMIAALAPDQPRARPLPPRALPRERDLERGIDRLRSAVREENPVEPRGHQRREPLRQPERQRVAELKGPIGRAHV